MLTQGKERSEVTRITDPGKFALPKTCQRFAMVAPCIDTITDCLTAGASTFSQCANACAAKGYAVAEFDAALGPGTSSCYCCGAE